MRLAPLVLMALALLVLMWVLLTPIVDAWELL
jgi:hypothetical protein